VVVSPLIALMQDQVAALLQLGVRAAFLNSTQSAETARALHVHPNTLRHRLNRVEQLTGRDLGSMEDRVDLYIALRSRP